MEKIRKDINKLSQKEMIRFIKAWRKINKGRREKSPLFKIASYHGYNKNHCTHGVPQFLHWHRIFLMEIDKILSQADLENGYDGNLTLPYWNWISDPKLPKICNIFNTFLNKFFKRRINPKINRNSNRRIKNLLKKSDLKNEINIHLNELRIDKFFNSSKGKNIEDIHNDIHVIIGEPMNSIRFAAFTIEFWLHHCFIDLLYESYIQNKMKNNIDIIKEYQKLSSRNRLYRKNFTPFKNENGSIINYRDIESNINYRYDKLWEINNNRIIETPIYCIIPELVPKDYENNSYLILCLCFENELDKQNFNIDEIDEIILSKNFAGLTSIFNKRDTICKNCQSRDKFDIFVNITNCLRKLNLSPYDTCIKLIVFNDEYKLVDNHPFQKFYIKSNIINFNNYDYKIGNNSKQIKEVQKHLQKIGFFEKNLDGFCGEYTLDCIKKFHNYFNVKFSNKINLETKILLTKKRYDYEKDNLQLQTIKNLKEEYIFSIHNIPDIYDRIKISSIIRKSLTFWEKITKKKFILVNKFKMSDYKIIFFNIDNKGNIISEKKNNLILLDSSENWNLEDEEMDNCYSLLTVITHEIGHLLGCHHINNIHSVMYPYYRKLDIYNKRNIEILQKIFYDL